MIRIFILVGFLLILTYPKSMGDLSISSGAISGSRGGDTCVRDPHIEFFMYHYIRDFDPRDTRITHGLSVPPGIFRMHMERVSNLAKEKKVFLMKGDDFLSAFRSGCFPGSPIWIFTADDGWSDMHDSLMPIATLYRVPFFLGIVTEFVGKSGFVSGEDLLELANNPYITIASHSLDHSDHSKLSKKQLENQICGSKSWLEKQTGKNIGSYIYPSGRIAEEWGAETLKKCNYILAWSTEFGKDYTGSMSSHYEINRRRIISDTDIETFDEIRKRGLK